MTAKLANATEELAISKGRASIRACDVLAIGLNAVDVLVRLPASIEPGTKHEVQELILQGGAPAGNGACVLSSLGWRTGFLARLGDNTLSAIARQELTRRGIADDFLISDSEASPAVAVVEIDSRTGERTVFYSLRGYRHVTVQDIDPDVIRGLKLLLVDGYESDATVAALEAASGTPCRSVADIEAGDPAKMRLIISLVSDAILPLQAAQSLTGLETPADVLHALSKWTRAQLIVTDDKRGSWAGTPGGVLYQPAFDVNTVDTTGCGDAYHGAYASALLDGLSLQLRMEFASWVASRVATSLGGRSAIPSLASIRNEGAAPLSTDLRRQLSLMPRWNI